MDDDDEDGNIDEGTPGSSQTTPQSTGIQPVHLSLAASAYFLFQGDLTVAAILAGLGLLTYGMSTKPTTAAEPSARPTTGPAYTF